MICRSNADSNSPLVTCHMFKFSFDPYNALMDVDAILQMRKKRCREVECFTQGCTASIRAQLSQDFGINTQTLVKLKQSWGSLVPSVTNSYRKVLLFLLTDSLSLILFGCFSCNLVCLNMRMLHETTGQILLCNKATRPLCGLYFPRCKMNWKRAFKDQPQPDLDMCMKTSWGKGIFSD